VEGQSLDPQLARRTPESIVKTAEDFYVSLGFPRLPASFWQRSDLYPIPPGSPRKKNAHASAWHIDGESDARSLMSVEANQQWFGTAHHELGHIYYYLSYSRPEVPHLLRAGANRAFHEAVGELARLASQQPPYVQRLGLQAAAAATGDPQPLGGLLTAALDSIVFLRFAAGTMSHFERDLYEQALPAAEWQARWWAYAARFQQVEPPAARSPDLCDACTKTHLNDDPAQYYDYALATLIKFQLHDHICRKILRQDVRACDYGSSPQGGRQVGEFLRSILTLGATRDWRELIQEKTGAPLGPRALLDYFAPLGPELARLNQGKCQ
jgi:peptidyl-dipeptidase A